MTQDTEPTIHVELDQYEIRALHFASSFLRDALIQARLENEEMPPDPPAGRTILPVDSALMKLETALITTGADF